MGLGGRLGGSGVVDASADPGIWLQHHTLRLEGGRSVGAWVGGHGVPLVMVSGFTAVPGFYVQTLARVAELGFRVVAIEAPGHGRSDGMSLVSGDLAAHASVIADTIDHLGITKHLLMGHSMGGRLVTHVAARRPEDTLGLVLIDPIVGATWDRLLAAARWSPPLLAAIVGSLVADSLAPGPLVRRPGQALTLGRLAAPTVVGHAIRPWRLAAPTLAILRSGRSAVMLDRVAEAGIPVTVIHGERDLIVPLQAGRDAAERCGGTLLVVHGGLHSWLLVDPGSLPVMLDQAGGVKDVTAARLGLELGDDRRWDTASAEAACQSPGALVEELAVSSGDDSMGPRPHRPSGHEWTVEDFRRGAAGR